MKSKSERHIFLDLDCLSNWDTNIVQRFPKAEKLQIEAPKTMGTEWDARGSGYPTVLYENGIYRMWYCVEPSAKTYSENADHMYSAYAESTDGIVWKKPDLKITAQNIWPGNNLLGLPGAIQGITRGLPGSRYRYYAIVIQISKPESQASLISAVRLKKGEQFFWVQMTAFNGRESRKLSCMGTVEIPLLIFHQADIFFIKRWG